MATQLQTIEPETAGGESLTKAPETADGPTRLAATTVYVTDDPGTSVSEESVLLIDRSALGVSVSVSVAELFDPSVSVTPTAGVIVAVLTIEPTAFAATVALIVNVAVPPTARSTVAFTLPVPLVASQFDPADAAQLQVALVSALGSASPTTALSARVFDTPVLETTTEYVTLLPGTADETPSVFVMDRSVLLVVTTGTSSEGVTDADPSVSAVNATLAVLGIGTLSGAVVSIVTRNLTTVTSFSFICPPAEPVAPVPRKNLAVFDENWP